MGSGKLIKRAIAKHGLINFIKEILFVFDNEADMNAKEAELVVIAEDSYNLCAGGKGGFGYINENRLMITETHLSNSHKNIKKAQEKHKLMCADPLQKALLYQNHSSRMKEMVANRTVNPFSGKTHTDATKELIGSKARLRVGEKSSQFGSTWITDGINNRKIKQSLENIPNGWYKGRTMKDKL